LLPSLVEVIRRMTALYISFEGYGMVDEGDIVRAYGNFLLLFMIDTRNKGISIMAVVLSPDDIRFSPYTYIHMYAR